MPAHNADVGNLVPLVEASPPEAAMTLYTYTEIAARLKVTVQTVEVWVKRGMIPSPLYFGTTARFTLDHLKQICAGVKPPQTYPASDSLRATQARAGKTKKREAKLKAARKITFKATDKPASKHTAGKGGAK